MPLTTEAPALKAPQLFSFFFFFFTLSKQGIIGYQQINHLHL